MSLDTNLPSDPIISKVRQLRTKSVQIKTPIADDGTVTPTFELVREKVVVTTFQSGAVSVERKDETLFTPDFNLVKAFVGASLPTGKKAVDFWEAFGDSLT